MQHISAHWRAMLTGFDGRPETLCGVNDLGHPFTNFMHRLFQRRYIEVGRGNLKKFVTAGRLVAKRQGRAFDLNVLRQCLTLALCDSAAPFTSQSYVVIGDGYAALGSILLEAVPNSAITFINIAPVLNIDRLYFERAHPGAGARFVGAERFDTMPDNFMSFDIACMGEINPDVINAYCATRTARSRYSYSCNRVSKTFPDGTVTRFSDYKWGPSKVLFDEPCPWHQTYYSFRPPFTRYFDGPVQHSLRERIIAPGGL